MYCPSCNSYNDDNSRFCSNCGAPLQLQQQAEQPNPGAFEQQQSSYNYQQPPYQPPYRQPAGAEPTKPITMATPVVAIILYSRRSRDRCGLDESLHWTGDGADDDRVGDG